MARKKAALTLRIRKEDLRPRPRAGVKASKVETPKKAYQRRPKHPKKVDE